MPCMSYVRLTRNIRVLELVHCLYCLKNSSFRTFSAVVNQTISSTENSLRFSVMRLIFNNFLSLLNLMIVLTIDKYTEPGSISNDCEVASNYRIFSDLWIVENSNVLHFNVFLYLQYSLVSGYNNVSDNINS